MADRLVIDASVAAKWFLDDELDVDLAEEILLRFLQGSLDLHAPRIFRYEVRALLAKACGSRKASGERRLSKEDGEEAVKKLFKLDIPLSDETEDGAASTLDMCVSFSKTFKDMSYLRLAIDLDCRFCTSDRRVRESVPATFPTDRVVLLSELRVR
ncbi:type II toxin-antitoxin system VapC family toxin [Aquisphaera insulae]|uniref:type II toxin-antitoxin system VapC family toxin n=1 Tax=Aquisphaera insulae TaxID=2712864 RepID=UPI0013EB6492|nr:type II toxin-antitoxin system VapC family toxin [Aquisphaera insulae]